MAPRSEPFRVLAVDDNEAFLGPLLEALGRTYDVRGATSAAEALECTSRFGPDIVLLDVRLPDADGLECLRRIKEMRPGVPVIMVTGAGDVRTAVAAIKLGAFDYIQKPFRQEDLEKAIGEARRKLSGEPGRPRPGAEGVQCVDPYRIVGETAAVAGMARLVEQVSRTDLNVLVQGESGTGKELVARAIHRGSRRWHGPFVAVNCARFSGDLIDSELFGHEKGAFTGATSLRRGVFELADGGTLLMDEIGTMPLATQDRLLRVVEEKRFTRVGGERPVEADVRLVFATNRDLQVETERGAFREDLYYRMKVVTVAVPPLRSRCEDIPLLVEHFLRKHGASVRSPLSGFTPEAMSVLQARPWRGNVRELENTIMMLMSVATKPTLDAQDLEALAPSAAGPAPLHVVGPDRGPEGPREGPGREGILRALDACEWNQSLAARRLGVHRNTLRNLMNRFNIRVRRSAE